MAEEATQPSPSQPEAPTVKSLSGFDEGTVLSTGETVKGTYNDAGILIGWHKESPAGGQA